MKNGDIEKANIYTCIETLNELTKISPKTVHVNSEKEMIDLLAHKAIYPCRLAIDLSDGSLIDFDAPITLKFMGDFASALVMPDVYLSTKVTNDLLVKREGGDILSAVQKEFIEKVLSNNFW
jgi:hypothetical protein